MLLLSISAGGLGVAAGGNALLHDGMESVLGQWDGAALQQERRFDAWGNFLRGVKATVSPRSVACEGCELIDRRRRAQSAQPPRPRLGRRSGMVPT